MPVPIFQNPLCTHSLSQDCILLSLSSRRLKHVCGSVLSLYRNTIQNRQRMNNSRHNRSCYKLIFLAYPDEKVSLSETTSPSPNITVLTLSSQLRLTWFLVKLSLYNYQERSSNTKKWPVTRTCIVDSKLHEIKHLIYAAFWLKVLCT